MEERTLRTKSGKRGHAVIEVALMAPWIFFLFMGVFNFGFYAYAMVSVTNAARSAALYASGGGQGEAISPYHACLYVLEEMRMMPNVGSAATCSCTDAFNCAAGPDVKIKVPPAGFLGPDNEFAAQVSVTYTSPQLFPIPGMTGLLTLTRTAVMKQ